MKEGLQNAPPEIRDCVQSKLGNVSEKIQNGELKGESDIQGVIQECASSFKPQGMMPKGMPSGGPPTGGMPPAGMGASPPSGAMPAVDCGAFAAVPSCSYVPESARAICEKCKAE